MKGKASTRSVVTSSGRLRGGAKGNQGLRMMQHRSGAGGAVGTPPQPSFSLYSTDSEDQLQFLHRRLDRCSALMNDMMNDEHAAPPSPPRTVTGGAAKPRFPVSSRGRKINNKTPLKTGTGTGTEQRSSHLAPTGQLGATPRTPRAPRTPGAPASHTGVKFPSSQKRLVTPRKPPPPSADRSVCEDDWVPVRDTGTPSNVKDPPLTSGRPLEGPPTNASSLQIQNTQLRRRGRLLNQQLQERERVENRQRDIIAKSHSDGGVGGVASVLSVQVLTELQRDLEDLRRTLENTQRTLEDTQRTLTQREAENALIQSELEAVREKLHRSERERERLTSIAHRRLEQTDAFTRVPPCWPVDVAISASDSRQELAAPPADRIAHYLSSLRKAAALERGEAVNGSRASDSSETLSNCSLTSGSTFNTKDEAAFRDGLAALDASIASLQRTIQLDLKT